MKLGAIQTKIYDSAYSCLKNAAHGNTQTAIENFETVHKLGKDNPAMTKLLCKKAQNDWTGYEISKEGIIPGFYPIKRTFNYLKFEFNKKYKRMCQDINEVYLKLYPKTYKMREKLINNNKVKID